jgi:hypothetical protein
MLTLFLKFAASQRFYVLKLLRQNGLCSRRLDWVFSALVVCRVNYAIEAGVGFLSKLAIGKMKKNVQEGQEVGPLLKKLQF